MKPLNGHSQTDQHGHHSVHHFRIFGLGNLLCFTVISCIAIFESGLLSACWNMTNTICVAVETELMIAAVRKWSCLNHTCSTLRKWFFAADCKISAAHVCLLVFLTWFSTWVCHWNVLQSTKRVAICCWLTTMLRVTSVPSFRTWDVGAW